MTRATGVMRRRRIAVGFRIPAGMGLTMAREDESFRSWPGVFQACRRLPCRARFFWRSSRPIHTAAATAERQRHAAAKSKTLIHQGQPESVSHGTEHRAVSCGIFTKLSQRLPTASKLKKHQNHSKLVSWQLGHAMCLCPRSVLFRTQSWHGEWRHLLLA